MCCFPIVVEKRMSGNEKHTHTYIFLLKERQHIMLLCFSC